MYVSRCSFDMLSHAFLGAFVDICVTDMWLLRSHCCSWHRQTLTVALIIPELDIVASSSYSDLLRMQVCVMPLMVLIGVSFIQQKQISVFVLQFKLHVMLELFAFTLKW